MSSITVTPAGPFDATVRPPGSKSITNRALVCASLADGRSLLRGALDSDDTRVMVDSLQRLGLEVVQNTAAATLSVVVVADTGHRREPTCLSGTAVRRSASSPRCSPSVRASIDSTESRACVSVRSATCSTPYERSGEARSETGNGCPPVLLHARGLPAE